MCAYNLIARGIGSRGHQPSQAPWQSLLGWHSVPALQPQEWPGEGARLQLMLCRPRGLSSCLVTMPFPPGAIRRSQRNKNEVFLDAF